jgi:hypothetical protein
VGVAAGALERGVRVADPPLGVGHEDDLGGLLDGRAQELALPRGGGVVLEHAQHRQSRTVRGLEAVAQVGRDAAAALDLGLQPGVGLPQGGVVRVEGRARVAERELRPHAREQLGGPHRRGDEVRDARPERLRPHVGVVHGADGHDGHPLHRRMIAQPATRRERRGLHAAQVEQQQRGRTRLRDRERRLDVGDAPDVVPGVGERGDDRPEPLARSVHGQQGEPLDAGERRRRKAIGARRGAAHGARPPATWLA